jgi:two-component system chemotaxis response regulator CheY
MSEDETIKAWASTQRFMVVEDDTSSRMLVDGLLRSLGAAQVETAGNGSEALEKIKSKGAPDVMFCDWNMPAMDGITLLSEVKRLYPSTRFVMLTANKEPDQVKSAAQHKVDGYIVKPFSRQTLVTALERLQGKAAAKAGG